jgi:hypothetical protein
MEEEKIKDYLKFQLNRNIISLYKKYFEMVDDLRQEHKLMIQKMEKASSKEFVENIDYFNEDKYNYIRKKILDNGNDAIRNIESSFKSITITLK